MPEGRLWAANLPHFFCGFIVSEGEIVHAAPIMAWAVGRPVDEFVAWVRRKGGKVGPVRA